MLLIGDVAINNYTNIVIKNIEIIYLSEHHTYIKNYFNIQGKGEQLNDYTIKYKLSNFINLILYRANEIDCFRELLINEFAEGREFKIASPSTLYKKLYITTSLMYKDVNIWKNHIKSFKKIAVDYIHNRLHHDRYIIRKLELQASKLYLPMQYSNLITNDYDTIDNYLVYSEENLHDIFMCSIVPDRNYLSLCKAYSSTSIKEDNWTRLRYHDKIDCLIEKIYVIASNEFLIKYIRTYGCLPLDKELKNILLQSYMIFLNQSSSEKLSKFLIFNFEQIVERLDLSFATILFNAIENDDLKKIKNDR